jgi:hypothetical protein
VVLLAACSAPEGVDDDAAIGRWTSKQDAKVRDDPSAVSVLYARVDRQSAKGSVIKTTFKTPITIDRLELSCYGRGTLDGSLTVSATRSSSSVDYPELQCGADPQTLQLTKGALRDVKELSFSGTNSSQASAWQLVGRD